MRLLGYLIVLGIVVIPTLCGRANQTVGGDFPDSGPCGTQRLRRGDFSLLVASARLENLANRSELPCD